MLTVTDGGGGGKNDQNLADLICERSFTITYDIINLKVNECKLMNLQNAFAQMI